MTTADVRGWAFWRDAAIVTAAIEAMAVAIWLWPASVHIVRWPASGPERLALLAPAWQLLLLGVVAAGVSGGLVAWCRAGRSSYAPTAQRELSDHLNTAGTSRIRWLRSFAVPFLVLWLWALPYLPWVGDAMPLLLALAGPARWIVLGSAVVAAIAGASGGQRLERLSDALNGRAVFAISFAVYVALGLNSVRVLGLGGDEPHYLIITESLLRDGDLQIENNHRQRDYRSFYPRELRPDYMQRGQNGAIYSIHAPGLPALLLPVYAVAGYRGAVVMICFLAALASLAIFQLAEAIAGRGAAALTWLAVCFTVPFVPYSWSIFPEMAGAVVVARAAWWVWRPTDARLLQWFWRGMVLAALPWMHTKFAVFFAIFGAALALRCWRRLPAVSALLTPMAISGVLWLYSFYAIYGSVDPEAPYGAYSRTYVLTRYIPHGLVGIFFDQKFGLLFYSPIYLVAVAGAWILLRRSETRYVALTLLATVMVFVASSARLYMFWGGSSAPARFLVPILPCLAPMIAVAIARAGATARRGTAGRAVIGVWMAISLGVALVGVASPARLMLFSDPHGRARMLEAIQAGSPLALVIPTFTEPDWARDLWPLALWLIAAAAALAAAFFVSRTRAGARAWGVAAVASLTFLLAGAVLTGRPSAAVREATARRGALDVLWRFDGTRLRTLDYQTFGRAAPDRLRDLSTIVFSHQPTDESADVAGAIDLPAGGYDAVVWFTTARPGNGEVVVAASPRATFARTTGTLTNPQRVAFELPVDVRRLTVSVPDRQVARAVARVEIVPRAVPPPGERPNFRARTIESLPEREQAYVVYVNDEAYPEGGVFWTRGTAAAEVVVAARGASRITFTLSTGPMSGTVTITEAGHSHLVEMRADESQTLTLALPQGQPLVPLAIQSSVMFRPGEVDRSSGDMRGLGCHVRIALD